MKRILVVTPKVKMSIELLEADSAMESSQPTVEPKVEQVQPPVLESISTSSLVQRRAFMRLSLEERRRLLTQQANEMLAHYQQNTLWQELETGDIVDY